MLALTNIFLLRFQIDKNQMREHMLDNHLGTLIEKIDSLESSFRESNWQKHSDKVLAYINPFIVSNQ